jgi:CheY-like chemotaxis protein
MVLSLEGMLSRVIGDDVKLVVDLDGEVRHTRVDPTLLEQVIVNLIVNARDAMPRGGEVSIRTRLRCRRTRSLDGRGDASEVSWVELSVTDTGEGIDPAITDQIFESYFTTKEMEKGTGLGLATVYGIVEQSGGDIEVESELGHGTTFTVRLPHISEHEAAPAELSAGHQGRPVSGTTVLIAEDEDNIREAVTEYLESLGLTVLQAEDGVAALEVVSRHKGKIDVLMTDLVMPRMSGPELVEHLLAERPELRVIFVSGYTPDAIREQRIDRDNMCFLQKPFLLVELAAAIREALDQ